MQLPIKIVAKILTMVIENSPIAANVVSYYFKPIIYSTAETFSFVNHV